MLPDPHGDVWGETDDAEDEDLDEPPPLPAMASAAEKPGAPPEYVSALGPPPDDAVAAAKWAYMMHMRLAHHAMEDVNLTPSQRRKEVRVTLAGAAKHMGDAMRYDVAQLIKKNTEVLEAKKRGRAQAKLEKRPPATGAKIIPIRRDG